MIHLNYQVHRHIWAGKWEVIKSIGKFRLIKLNRSGGPKAPAAASLLSCTFNPSEKHPRQSVRGRRRDLDLCFTPSIRWAFLER